MSDIVELPPNLDHRDLRIATSPHFVEWLSAHSLSLAVTTYQSNRLFLIGVGTSGKLSISALSLNRPMGLFAAPPRLTITTLYQIWHLENIIPEGETHQGFDRLYMPRTGFTTGQLNVHDLVIDKDDELFFINTRFNCLATLSARGSFRMRWKPKFISSLVPEDRCHLNGLALVDGKPRHTTCVSRSDQSGGWRNERLRGGCVIDITTDEVICENLSMPHSPRFQNEKLWLLNSGQGDLGYVDLCSGRFEPIAFLPGYCRGLAFANDSAIVGLSKPRGNGALTGLPFEDRMARGSDDFKCGLWVVELNRGAISHWLQFEGLIGELYDVQVLKGVTRPGAIGFESLDIRRHILVETESSVAPQLMDIR
ncbi:MAG TPA: TIGR03032 family protein [Pyrinomonadaceae bacterium]